MDKEDLKKRLYLGCLEVDDCWVWMKNRDGNGYGRFYSGSRVILAHRLSYILHYGEIPESLLICHKCDNPPCCNPLHLFAGTHKDNFLDAIKKGRAGGPNSGQFKLGNNTNATRTHCHNGHPYSGENLLIHHNGKSRLCRECRNANSRRHKEKIRSLKASKSLMTIEAQLRQKT